MGLAGVGVASGLEQPSVAVVNAWSLFTLVRHKNIITFYVCQGWEALLTRDKCDIQAPRGTPSYHGESIGPDGPCPKVSTAHSFHKHSTEPPLSVEHGACDCWGWLGETPGYQALGPSLENLQSPRDT